MSQSAITTAFEDYLTQQVASGGVVTLDRFIFANVPDLDPDAPIDRGEQIPVDYIVYQQDVTLPSVINSNEVVYSVTMGTEVGDFDFNWIGLVNSTTSLLAMVTHAPVQQKFKNADGQQGNTLTRSFLMEYDGAATATTITTPAETWQIDFTARLAGMDDRQRLENMDIYGYGAFFGDGYLVWGNPTDGYTIDAGVGYVSGLRVQLDADQPLNVTEKPINVYVDACWKGTLTSTWYVEQQITLASDLSNYTDPDGTAHYVFAVASIDVNGAVTDLRPSGSKDNQALSGYLQTKNNLSEIADVGAEAQTESRVNIGCGTAATLDATTSTTDNTVGHALRVGDRGLARTLINAIGIDFDTYLFAAGETLFLKMTNCTNIPDGVATSFVYAYVDVIGVRDTKNDVGILIGDAEGTKYYWAMRYTYSSGETEWIVRILPQSAADISAVPQYSDPLAVDLNTLDGTKPGRYQQPKSNAATTANHYPAGIAGALDVIPTGVSVDGSSLPLGCVQEYRPYDVAVLYRRTYSVSGGVWSWSGWAEEYSTVNPPPATDLSAYITRSDALNTFVQRFAFGAVTQVAVSGNQYAASPGYVLSAIQDNDTGNYPSFDSVDAVYQKPAQMEINNNWFTVAG